MGKCNKKGGWRKSVIEVFVNDFIKSFIRNLRLDSLHHKAHSLQDLQAPIC